MEGSGRQPEISGLAERASPTEAFLMGQRYRNALMQRDSISFEEEHRRIERSVPHFKDGCGFKKILRSLEHAEGTSEEA